MSDELQKQLAVLKENYLQSLPAKIDELCVIWKAAIETSSQDKAEELHRKAHSLAGSGATFDQVGLSRTSKILENFVKERMEKADLLNEGNVTTVNSLLLDIEKSYSDEESIDSTGAAYSPGQQEKTVEINEGNTDIGVNSVGKMTILVADDDTDNRKRLEIILESQGHKVVVADNGKEAVEMNALHSPDVILMDVIMPVMTGYDAARIIKNELASRFVPIIFLTAITDNESLAGCISAGGDDFVNKPVHPLILNAKLSAFQRISQMYEKLDEYQKKNEEEMEASKEVFDSLIYVNDQEIDGLNTWTISPGHFSGDTHLYTKMDNGHIYVLLCDFTGHGLPAAIGTVFVSDLFRSMTAKHIPANEILNEINSKMNQILPTGRYCAAIMLDYSVEEKNITLWNCGLPDAYVTDEQHKISAVYPSESVPLGVLSGKVLATPIEIDTSDINEVVIFSDGITEAEDPEGNMYGDEKLRSLIENTEKEQDLFLTIKTDLENFMDGEEPTDDITLIVFKLNKGV